MPSAGAAAEQQDRCAALPPHAVQSAAYVDFRIDDVDCRIVRPAPIDAGARADRVAAKAETGGFFAEVARFELRGTPYVLLARSPANATDADNPAAAERSDFLRLLTQRELQIVQLICTGCLTKQVADRLRISEFTVRSYLKTIYCKLGVRSRGAMVYRYAQALGYVQSRPGRAGT